MFSLVLTKIAGALSETLLTLVLMTIPGKTALLISAGERTFEGPNSTFSSEIMVKG